MKVKVLIMIEMDLDTVTDKADAITQVASICFDDPEIVASTITAGPLDVTIINIDGSTPRELT